MKRTAFGQETFAVSVWTRVRLRLLLGCFLILPVVSACRGETNAEVSPYQAIVDRDRNPFGLRPVVAQKPPPKPAVSNALRNYKLTGVAADGTNVCAYLALVIPGKPMKYYTVSKGDHLETVTVDGINIEAGTVTLSEAHSVEVLSFETHGLKLPPSALAASSRGGLRTTSRIIPHLPTTRTSGTQRPRPDLFRALQARLR
jgi:hypothetical protein